MEGSQFLGAAIIGMASGFFWLVARAVPLWLCRRFAPHTEWWLTAPLSKVIARLAGLAGAALRRAHSGGRRFR